MFRITAAEGTSRFLPTSALCGPYCPRTTETGSFPRIALGQQNQAQVSPAGHASSRRPAPFLAPATPGLRESREPAPLGHLRATGVAILFAKCPGGSLEVPRDFPLVIQDSGRTLAEYRKFSLELGCLGGPSGPIGGR